MNTALCVSLSRSLSPTCVASLKQCVHELPAERRFDVMDAFTNNHQNYCETLEHCYQLLTSNDAAPAAGAMGRGEFYAFVAVSVFIVSCLFLSSTCIVTVMEREVGPRAGDDAINI